MTGPTFATHAPTSPPKAPRPATKPGEKPDDAAGARILIYLKLHWLMIVFCGMLIGGAGAAAAWELLASKYESYGLFQVAAVQIQIANQNPNQARTDFSTYVKTQITLLKSEFVLNAALRDIKDLPTIKAQKDPLKFLDEELQVSWQDGSEVVRVTFKGHEPADAQKIVNAVQKAFIERWIEHRAAQSQKLLEKVEEAQTRIKNTIDGQTPSRAAKPGTGVVPAGGTAPGPTVPGALPPIPGMTAQDRALYTLNPGILVNEIVTRRKEIANLPLFINAYKREQEVLKERLDTIQKAPVPKHIEEMIEKDQDVFRAKLMMTESMIRWERVKNNSTNPNLPAVLEYKTAYEADKKRYEELRADKLKTLEGARKLELAGKVAGELEKLIAATQRYEEQFAESKKALATAEKQYAELPLPVVDKGTGLVQARHEKEYNPAESAVQVTDGLYRTVMQQYQLAKLEVESPPRVTILQGASMPTQKDTKKQVLGTAFASVIGFVLMALGVVGYETMSRRVSSLADVKVSVPSPVVGVIPGLPADAAGKDPARRAAANEAIDKLRAYVSQTWLSRGATTITITSPIGDEGKAFASFGLASSLAQAGYKTLLVDFDLREPAIHPYAGVQNLAGVCELLRAETDVRSVVQFLPNGLHLLPAGKWSDEARKAATGEKLESLLSKLKEPYDCVVIHGHALLTVAESVEVARRCEVVLLCAKYRETAAPLLKRAAERVATMEIPYSGVVYVGATDQEALC